MQETRREDSIVDGPLLLFLVMVVSMLSLSLWRIGQDVAYLSSGNLSLPNQSRSPSSNRLYSHIPSSSQHQSQHLLKEFKPVDLSSDGEDKDDQDVLRESFAKGKFEKNTIEPHPHLKCYIQEYVCALPAGQLTPYDPNKMKNVDRKSVV